MESEAREKVEEDLLAEVQRLRAENEYLKNLKALVVERTMPGEKVLLVQKLRQRYSLSLLLEIAELPRATFYYHAVSELKNIVLTRGKWEKLRQICCNGISMHKNQIRNG